MPFREPHRGIAEIIAYIDWSFSEEEVVDVRFADEPLVDGRTAVIEFVVHALENGAPATLAGCVFVTFGEDGQAVETHDYWHSAEGHR
jgi:hypothetical protein